MKVFKLLFTAAILYLIPLENVAQNVIKIDGFVKEQKHWMDTLVLIHGIIDPLYYQKPVLKVPIRGGKFEINEDMIYPHLYFPLWESETGNVAFYPSEYFIDSTTTKIVIDSLSGKVQIDGNSSLEFKNKFMPHIRDKGYASPFEYFLADATGYEQYLQKYSLENPDSFVALWLVARRFSENGHSLALEAALKNFSKVMQSTNLWKVVGTQISNIEIKEGHRFPHWKLKDENLSLVNLSFPETKYTLVDFWFSRCLPCLEALPEWVRVYKAYKGQGLNVVGISVDRVEDVSLWKKRIVEKGIPWKNYLDENGVKSFDQKIFNFPSNYLLDKEGKIIAKNISAKELETLLKK